MGEASIGSVEFDVTEDGRVMTKPDADGYSCEIQFIPVGKVTNVYHSDCCGYEREELNDDLRVKSDGGPTSYYELPEHATELRHLISHKGMSFARGNMFKALYRLGEKEGTGVLYDLNKLQVFIDDMREMHERGERL